MFVLQAPTGLSEGGGEGVGGGGQLFDTQQNREIGHSIFISIFYQTWLKCCVNHHFFISLFQEQPCRYNPTYRAANCSQYKFLPEGDENTLKQALGTIGPISVAIDATRPRFTFYRSGKKNITR